MRSLIQDRKKVVLRFIRDVLGVAPSSPQIYERYLLEKLNKEIDKIERKLAKKNLREEERAILENQLRSLQDELANLPEVVENTEKATQFYRAPYGEYEVPVIRAHQVQGFFKEAGNNFKDVFKIKALRDKISKYVRVQPINLFIYDEEIKPENLVDEPDGFLERPLQAMTPQGPRVSIAKSEVIYSNEEKGFKLIEFEVILFKNPHFDFSLLETLMRELGPYGGIGRWRNAGYGAFEVVKIEDVK